MEIVRNYLIYLLVIFFQLLISVTPTRVKMTELAKNKEVHTSANALLSSKEDIVKYVSISVLSQGRSLFLAFSHDSLKLWQSNKCANFVKYLLVTYAN